MEENLNWASPAGLYHNASLDPDQESILNATSVQSVSFSVEPGVQKIEWGGGDQCISFVILRTYVSTQAQGLEMNGVLGIHTLSVQPHSLPTAEAPSEEIMYCNQVLITEDILLLPQACSLIPTVP